MEKGWIDEKRNRMNNPHYNPDALLDFAIDKLDLKNNTALARLLGMNPTTISKIRHRVFPIGDAILVDLAEALDMPTRGLKRIAGMLGTGRQTVFVSGPMTGIENFNYPAFNRAAEALRKLGYTVLTPAENPEQDSWEGYMRHALIQLLQCDVVAQLPGWEDSRGARMEHDVARELSIPCLSVDYLLMFGGTQWTEEDKQAMAGRQHAWQPINRIDLGAPLEFCGVDIDACHTPANERAAA